jgi:hypothetical protein
MNGLDPNERHTDFEVVVPSSTFTAATGTVRIGPFGVRDGEWLSFGDLIHDTGISFNGIVGVSGRPGGDEIGLVQTLDTSIEETNADQTRWSLSSKGTPVLDSASGFFYNAFTHATLLAGANGAAISGPTATDSPASPLWNGIVRVSRTDHFVTYLMYKPVGDHNIWVPLKRMDWGWSASAAKGIIWNYSSLPEHSINSESEDTVLFPDKVRTRIMVCDQLLLLCENFLAHE